MEAIGLNPIRLDAIGIDPIRLNAIRLGVPGASSGSSARPYIDPEVLASLVAVCICDGKSNDDPDRAVIKNLVDPDNPFVISNAAYKLNSGYGKYEEDFTNWSNTHSELTPFSIITTANYSRVFNNISLGKDIPSFTIEVVNKGSKIISYSYIDESGKRKSIGISKSGKYRLPASYLTKYTEEDNAWVGFMVTGDGFCSITQIPSFQGALVTDGVDDLIVSSKTVQEMLDGSTELSVVTMMCNLTNDKATYNNQIRPYVEGFIRTRFINNSGGKLSISGYTIKNINYNASIPSSNTTDIKDILGDKNDFGREITNGKLDGVFSVEGYRLNTGIVYELSQVAWYWTFIAKRALTTDEINQVIAYYNLDKYVKPDVYYDVKKQGLSNDTPDADWYLKDFSGNGRNMQLYNFAKKLGSGIGKYNEDFKTWFQMTNGTAIISHDKLRVNKVGDINGGNFIAWKLQSEIKAFKAKITGIPKDANISYVYSREGSVRESIIINTDGEYDLPYSHPYASGVGFAINGNFPKEAYIGVTIEQISDYEGALVFDAVEDYGQFVGDLGLKDYTVAVDRAYPSLKSSGVPVSSDIKGTTAVPFLFEFAITDSTRPYSFGETTVLSPMELNRKISYQSTYIYNGRTINKGVIINKGEGLTIGRFGVDRQYANIALWSFLLFPYTLSEFLLERQLKRYKLGTLYPDMVEVRPIINSTGKYFRIEYRNGQGGLIQPGSYLPVGSILRISVVMNDDTSEVSSLKVNGVDIPETDYSNGRFYIYDATVTKSPQKIDITIDEYIRYEDIVQPYPAIVNLRQNDKNITWGDKLKVGSEVTFVNHTNLLPELYAVSGGVSYNGVLISNWGSTIKVAKSMTFTNVHSYKKDNEPNCILAPQTLRIPNSSYKILGYIPDLTGKGNHGKINNSAYAGMSGANGYVLNFEQFTTVSDNVVLNDNTIRIVGKLSNTRLANWHANTSYPKSKLKISGIPSTGHVYLYQSGTFIELFNGTNDIEAINTTGKSVNFSVNVLGLDWTTLVIEEVGNYEGSFCLDGVEDFITIPTLSHGAKQVLMKVNTQNMNGVLYDQRKSSGQPWHFAVYNTTEADSVAYNARNTNGKTYIDGVLNANITCQQLLNITHNLTITNNGANEQNTQSPVIGASRSAAANFSKFALFVFMSFPEISDEDEIKELNDIVGIEGGYVESSDYYWDAYGKANRATQDIDYLNLNQASNAHHILIDKSKAGLAALDLYHDTGNITELNNRRLTANNFAYNTESGYSEIADTWLFNQWIPYGGNRYIEREQINNTTIRITKSNIASVDSFYARTNINKKAYYKITGLQQGQAIQFGYTNDIIYTAESDGVHEVDWSLTENRAYQELGCTFVGNCNIVIEQVAQYQNGLVGDGVDDHLINTIIPALTDFTVIAKRTILDTPVNSAFLCKGSGFYDNGSAFMLEFKGGNDQVSSFGVLTSSVELPELITYMTSTNYNGKTINKGTIKDREGICVGIYRNVYYWKGVFYKAMLYSKTIDMLSINMLKNLFAKDELIDVNNPIFKK
ncbi:hypothetical protein [Bacteroides acidifaciens]|uniref:hypothetical protein n=1 Tax=Bacteroides acidifaciens TaxID=85831 RepID=UPI00158E3EDA|nr:hypothetical protein [Bacteroides acidifaciens]